MQRTAPTLAAWRAILLLTVAAFSVAAQDERRSERLTREQIARLPVMPIGKIIEDRNGDTIPDALGQRVRIRAVVTIGSGIVADERLQVYVEDATGGTYLFSRRDPGPPLRAGEIVDASGVVDQYRGATQISDAQFSVVGQTTPPKPLGLDVKEAVSGRHYGRLVTVEGRLGTPAEEGPNVAVMLEGDGSEIKVVFPRNVVEEVSFRMFPPRSRVRVTGVVSIYSVAPPHNDGYRLLVGDPSWIALVARPLPAWVRWVGVALGALLLLVGIHAAVLRFLRARTKERQREVAVLNALAGVVGGGASHADSLLRESVEVMSRFGLIEGAAVHLTDGQEIRFRGAYGIDAEKAKLLDEQIAAGAGKEAADAEAERGSVLSVPLQGRSRMLGVLTVFMPAGRAASPQQVATIAAAANLIALGIENLQVLEQSQQSQEELKQLAITDPLTGLYNRRFLDEYLRIHLPMARRQSAPVSFITIDLDHFKMVNDEHGHEAGDTLLADVGKTIRRMTRASDLPVRLGGEEFLVVMPDTNEAGAVAFAARLQNELKRSQITIRGTALPRELTASFGVAIYPDHGESARQLLRAGDDALYQSKRAGRDRITVAPPPFWETEDALV